MVPLLLDKLPESIRLSMIRFHEKDQLDWTVEDLLQGLEKEIAVRESTYQSRTPVPQMEQTRRQEGLGHISQAKNMEQQTPC